MCYDNSPFGFGTSSHVVDRLITLAWIAIIGCGAAGIYVAYQLIAG